MKILRQSTAVTLKIGPFIDETDGKTAETGLTIAQADVRISKNGANIIPKNEATSCTHDELGVYGCPLDITDTNTLGLFQLWVHESGALPAWHEYTVVTANVYDSLCSTDVLQADLTQLGGVAQSATDLKDFADAGYDPATNKVQGVVLTDTTTTNTDMVGTPPTVGAIRTEMEGAGTKLTLTLEDTADLQGNQAAWATATGFSTHSAANVWAVAARTLTASTNFNDLDAAAVKAEAVAALADIKLDHLLNIAVDTDWATTVHLNSVVGHMADVGTAATYDRTTDALEAIRNRGDAAWVTATGFSTHSAANVWSVGTRAITDKAGFSLSTAGIKAIWDQLTNVLTTVGSIGKLFVDNINATISSRNSTTPPTVGEIRNEMEGAGSKILAIEGDTNELQTNQSNWATAIGFSTHNAADVKTSVEQAGSSLAQILEDTGTTLPADIAAVGSYLLKAEIATVTDQTHITLATGSDVDDAYKDQTIVLYDDSNSDFPSVRKITAYTGATKAATLDSAADFTVGADDSVMIFVTAPGTTAPTVSEIAAAVWNSIITGATYNLPTSAGRRLRETGAYAIEGGTAQAGNGFSITLAATASGDDGVYNRNLIVLVDNTGAGQTRTIVDYNATSKVCVIDREWRVSPDATTTYQIVPDDTPLTVDHGRARGGTSTTIILRDYASSINDTYLCNQIGIIAGPGRGQNRLVGAYNGTSKTVTICGDPWVTTPTTDSIYVMMPYGTTCTSCMGDYALGQIKDECDDALSDVNLHKHDQNIKAIIRSEY